MTKQISLDELWNLAPDNPDPFSLERIRALPEAAHRYLAHAIAPGTSLASAVRLRMHGEIKLKGWCPFTAEQVTRWDRGMVWQAAVRMYGIPIRGGDTVLDGQTAMRWKLFGIFPMINASGPDISRSGAGRVNIESVWLPSVLCGPEVAWTDKAGTIAHARFSAHGETAEIDYVLDESGGLRSVKMPRWGNPEGADFRYADFNGAVEEEGTFGGYTIPTRLRIGWGDTEFFRATIDEAIYR